MNLKWAAVFVVLYIVFFALRKRLPKTWKLFQLLIDILVSVASLVMIICAILGTMQVLASDVGTSSKVLFVLFAVLFNAVILWADYRIWEKRVRAKQGDTD